MWHDYWFSGKSCTIWIAKAFKIVLLYNFFMICITDRNYSVFIRLIFNHDSMRSKHKWFLSCCKLSPVHWKQKNESDSLKVKSSIPIEKTSRFMKWISIFSQLQLTFSFSMNRAQVIGYQSIIIWLRACASISVAKNCLKWNNVLLSMNWAQLPQTFRTPTK